MPHACLPERELRTDDVLFPGIRAVHQKLSANDCVLGGDCGTADFEIRYCREGRMEGCFQGLCYVMEPGDLLVKKAGPEQVFLPYGRFDGVSVLVESQHAPASFSCLLSEVDVRPAALLKKLCGGGGFLTRAFSAAAPLFDRMEQMPADLRRGYLQIKVLELMLALSAIRPEDGRELPQCSGCNNPQRLLAQAACRYISGHLDQRLTLEKLCAALHVSGTQLKSSIRAVYGSSFRQMVRALRMEAASRLLSDTDLTVMEIAGRFGYDNASKFAAAFCAVMGVTPREYRSGPPAEKSV